MYINYVLKFVTYRINNLYIYFGICQTEDELFTVDADKILLNKL